MQLKDERQILRGQSQKNIFSYGNFLCQSELSMLYNNPSLQTYSLITHEVWIMASGSVKMQIVDLYQQGLTFRSLNPQRLVLNYTVFSVQNQSSKIGYRLKFFSNTPLIMYIPTFIK